MRRILVLRGGALGDFIVTLPALRSLRERWPDARIELAGNTTAAVLAQSRGLLDAVHSQHEARWAALYGDMPLSDPFAAWLAEFDLVLSFWPDPDGELRARFPLRAGQIFRSTAALPTQAPAAAHYCEPLREFGIVPADFFHRLEPLPTPRPVASTPILLHPGSGSPAKNWPAENWRRLIARLPLPISIILGPAERAWLESARDVVTDARGERPVSLVDAPLEELVTHFAGCRLFVGHDSGISHLAAATGARCVLLFGPTDPALWAPPAANVRVVQRGNAMNAISVSDVLPLVEAALADQT